MRRHILKTVVKPSQHLRKVTTPYEISGSRRIESSCYRLQVVVVFQILVEIISELFNSLLLFNDSFALFLKGRCLRLDIFE